jgi:pantoate--beta-alanine ligase
MDVKIIIAPIVRESDGLAMSSRNVRLTPENRKKACVLSSSLFSLKKDLENGGDLTKGMEKVKQTILSTHGAEFEYLEARSYPLLETVKEIKQITLIALAVRFADVRLIDNILIHP